MGLVNVDIDLLRTLIVVADLKNFTAAGEKLHRTQSAISLQIKRLEQAVGEKIFERGSGKEVHLTKTGELVLSYATEILLLNDRLIQKIQSNSQVTVLRIGMPDDYAELLLPKIIAELARHNKAIEMQIVSELSMRLGTMIDHGQLDIAFMTRHDGIGGFKLLDEGLSWVSVSDAHVANDTPLPLALFPEGCGVRHNALEALDAIGRRWHIAYCSSHFSALKAAILQRQAVGVLPTRAIPPDMVEIDQKHDLPKLKNSELVVRMNPQASTAVVRLATHLLRAFEVDLAPEHLLRPTLTQLGRLGRKSE